MYLDTLKVSTVEQSAEQVSARGGLGNAELITWDYGKDISITLEDALFTPASQSLMWGGKFGVKNSKVYGVWNPIEYPRDDYNRRKFITQEVVEANMYQEIPNEGVYYPVDWLTKYEDGYWKSGAEVDETNLYTLYQDQEEEDDDISPVNITEANGWYSFVCPCDNKLKYMRYVANINGVYKYYKTVNVNNRTIDQMTGAPLNCPKGYPIHENGVELKGYYANEITNLTSWGNSKRPELAELALANFGKFSTNGYKYSIAGTSGNEYCDSTTFNGKPMCGNAVGYFWEDADLKMTSLEGDQDLYYSENAGIEYRTAAGASDKFVMVSRRGLYETTYNASTKEWEFVPGGEEIVSSENLAERYNTSGTSYGWKMENYLSKVDFFINVPWATPDNPAKKYIARVKVGTFYIIADWNYSGDTPQDLIWPINSGMEDVYFLERMEKCKAPQTFCIDADKNLISNNYRSIHDYDETELTVYIDPKTMKPYEPNSDSFTRQNGAIVNGNLRIIKQYEVYYKWTRTKAPNYTSLGHRIIVDATHFPGTYRLIGETYVRSRETGKDQRYQFEIPLAKMGVNNNITLQADGDPTTFTMTMKALRREDGVMMKLTQYDVDCNYYDGYNSGSTKVVPRDELDTSNSDFIDIIRNGGGN